MKDVYFFNERKAEDYLEKYGTLLYSDVYKTDDKVIKKINFEKSQSILYNARFSYDNLLQFKNIDIRGISFAKALAYTGFHKVYGIISEYVKGYSLKDKSLSSYKIDDVITAIGDIEVAIKKLSELNITVNDIHSGNIIFDGNNMTLIDTTEYYYVYNDSLLYEMNMIAVMEVIFDDLFFSFFKNGKHEMYNIYNLFTNDEIKLNYIRKRDFLMNPVETLYMAKKWLEEELKLELNSFDECHKYMDNIIRSNKKIKRR